MGKINDCYNESKQYSESVIKDVIKSLENEKIEYTINSNNTEISVKTEYDKNEMFNIISKHISTPKMVLLMLIDITEVNDTIYIRQKTK